MAGTSPAMTQEGTKTMTEIRVPTLGESVTEATIGRWFKKAGDAVAVDEPLVELETDKVTIEVPAPSAGVLGEIAAKDGETVAVGALLGQINDGAVAAKPAAAPPPKAAAPAAAPAPAAAAKAAPADAPLAPSVRKLSAESGVDASTVPGSGKDGRVTKGDMLAAIEKAASAPTPVNQPAASVQVRSPSPADDAAREEREKRGIDDVYLMRVEQLYPVPLKALVQELGRFKGAELVWCQEEPRNMGSWHFIEPYLEWVLNQINAPNKRPRYAGRAAAAATATGLMSKHLAQLKALLDDALN